MNKSSLYIIIALLFIACETTKQIVVLPIEPTAPKILSAHNKRQVIQTPKNIILMIGDGMGISQITAGIYMSNNYLNLERFKHIGLQKTHSSSSLVTESAEAATAIACGKKAYKGAIAVDKDTLPIVTILELAQMNKMSTGLVVTSTIVHATPACFVSHNKGRYNYEEIALDIANQHVDILIGGGIKYFNRRKKDNRNLISELRKKGYKVNTYLDDEIENIEFPISQKFAYFSADKDPLPAYQGRDYLDIASKKTIFSLDKMANNGFFLMIEGSQIDWGGHANNSDYIVSEMLDFDKTIGSVLDWAEKDGETLLIVTADHETGGYSLNKGSKMGKIVTNFSTKDHTATLIPVFAYGPGASSFQGIYDNTAIFDKMKKLLEIKAHD